MRSVRKCFSDQFDLCEGGGNAAECFKARSCSFTNQTLAQLELWKEKDSGKYFAGGPGKYKVYTLPKILDEKVAALHLTSLGVELTKLSAEQADYIGVPVNGPFKPETYRY